MAKIETKWIGDSSVTKHKVNLDVAGAGLIGGGGDSLSVVPVISGGIYVDATGVGVNLNSYALSSDNNGLSVIVDDTSIEINAIEGLKVKDEYVEDLIEIITNPDLSGVGEYIIDSPGGLSDDIEADFILDVVRDFHDIKVWIHPTEPSDFRIITSDSNNSTGGIYTYKQEANGSFTSVQSAIGSQELNHLDIRHDIPLIDSTTNEKIDVVLGAFTDASVDANNKLVMYSMNANGTLNTTPISTFVPSNESDGFDLGEINGCCFYISERINEYNVLVNSAEVGLIKQYKVIFETGVSVTWEFLRDIIYVDDGNEEPDTITDSTRIKFMEADDHYGFIYVTVASGEIRRYRGDGSGGTEAAYKTLYIPNTVKLLKGVTIYETDNDDGYVIIANVDAGGSGDTEYLVYDRRVNHISDVNTFIGWFSVYNGTYNVNGNAIAVVPTHLGNNLDRGAFFCLDDNLGDFSFNIIKWQNISEGFNNPLLIDYEFNPRTNRSAYYTRPLISSIFDAVPVDQGPVVLPLTMSRSATSNNTYLQWGTDINSNQVPLLIPYKSTPLAVSCTVRNATQFRILVYTNTDTPYVFTTPAITLHTGGSAVTSVYDDFEDLGLVWEEGILITVKCEKITGVSVSNPAVNIWVRTIS